MSTTSDGVVTGNVYDKYRTANPVYRRLMAGFLGACDALLGEVRAERTLEVGCGPGDLVRHLSPSLALGRYSGLDLGLDQVARAHRDAPDEAHLVGSAYSLPFPAGQFDCVLACEVLEHLEHPTEALAEVRRVARGHVLVSVPWEPTWRLLNLARGAYWRDLGNTPGHLQHFSRSGIVDLVGRTLEVVAVRRPFPWTVLLARTRR